VYEMPFPPSWTLGHGMSVLQTLNSRAVLALIGGVRLQSIV